jgi:hypothetical protein
MNTSTAESRLSCVMPFDKTLFLKGTILSNKLPHRTSNASAADWLPARLGSVGFVRPHSKPVFHRKPNLTGWDDWGLGDDNDYYNVRMMLAWRAATR